MADTLPLPAPIRRCGCGTLAVGKLFWSTVGMLVVYGAWHGRPVVSISPRPVLIRRYGCGVLSRLTVGPAVGALCLPTAGIRMLCCVWHGRPVANTSPQQARMRPCESGYGCKIKGKTLEVELLLHKPLLSPPPLATIAS